jgi:hypothetical protein
VRWLVLVVTAAALAGVWWRLRAGIDRQRRLMFLCRRAGLEFAPLDMSPDTAWLPFPMFGHSEDGTENVVWDRGRDEGVRAFDFWYQDSGDERTLGPRRRFTCAMAPLWFTCARLRVAPRDVVDDVAGVLSGHEVRLELEEFDRRFRVESEDGRFAVAFLDQRMMEGLARARSERDSRCERGRAPAVGPQAACGAGAVAVRRRGRDQATDPARRREPVPLASDARTPGASLASGTVEPGIHRRSVISRVTARRVSHGRRSAGPRADRDRDP